MNVSKAALSRTLRSLAAFDPAGSPFVGIQWSKDGLAFRRTGGFGIIESIHYDGSIHPTIVTLSHFRDMLQMLDNEEIIVDKDRSGFLRLAVAATGDNLYSSELRVHTAHPDTPWATRHVVGKHRLSVPVDTFKGIHVSGFPLSNPPIHRANRLVLPTNAGVVVRNQVPSVGASYPRESLLWMLGGEEAREMYVTDTGFWVAVIGGLRVLVSGHHRGDAIYDLYTGVGPVLAEFPAARLLFALKTASNLAQDGGRIQLDPKTGISTRDRYNNIGEFSLGTQLSFPTLSLTVRSAKVLVEALSQTTEDTIALTSVPLNAGELTKYRMTRGLWEVYFQV